MTTPIGADVTIGGKSYGQSPLTIEQILEGEYDVVMSKAGCATVMQHVAVAEGKSVEVSATLPQGREITISCATADAHIVVDGTDMGASPYTGSLSFGSHKVYATAGGKRTAERTVDVPNGIGVLQPVALSFLEKPFTVEGVQFTMVAIEDGTFTMSYLTKRYDDYDPKNLSITAFINRGEENGHLERQIINSQVAEVPLPVGIHAVSDDNAVAFRNGSFYLNGEQASVFTVDGKRVNNRSLTPGVYLLKAGDRVIKRIVK